MTRIHTGTGEALLTPVRNGWSKVVCITGVPGKSNEGGRVADGFVVALIQSNVCGAKEPC